MKLKELLETRFSVRSYQNREVEREKIEYLLECARLAPSACNLQPWSFIVVQSPEAKKKVQEAYPREWFLPAACYIIACGNRKESWKRKDGKDSVDIDVSIAAEHICLAAEELGLGTCWVCNFETRIIKQNFQLPDEVEPMVLFPIGYPAEDIQQPEQKRKSLNDIVEWK